MEMQEKIARYKEIERRGLLDQLPVEKQELWAEIKRRGLDADTGTNEQPQTIQAKQDPYSSLDKAKYFGRAAGEGITFGLGDVVAGYTNTLANDLADVTHGKDLATRAKGYGKYLVNTVMPGMAFMSDDFKQGRKDFVEEQKAFADVHPVLNTVGEIVGGLGTGIVGAGKAIAQNIGKQGIKQIAKQSFKEGVKFGGAYGGGSGLTQNAEELSPEGAVKGTVGGAIGGGIAGAVLPVGLIGGKRGIEAFFGTQGYAKRAAKEIFDEAGGKTLGQIVRSNKGTRALKEAIKADDVIAKRVRDAADEQIINSADKTKQIINDTLGIDNIVNAKEQAQALYDDVVNNSPSALPISIYKNKATREALKRAINEDYTGQLKQKGLNSLSVAQRAKEKLDDMIEASYELGDYGIRKATSKTRELMKVKNDFLNTVDQLAPDYKMARKEFERATKPYELLEGLNKDTGQERSNTIKAILSNKNKAIMRDVFGQEKAEKLFTELRNQSIENDRFTKLYNAAENKLTKEATKAQGLIREALESVGSVAGHALDMARLGGATRGRRNIGRVLLDAAGREDIKQNWRGMQAGGPLVRADLKPDTQIYNRGMYETNNRYSPARRNLMKNNGKRVREIYENGSMSEEQATNHPRKDGKISWRRISEKNDNGTSDVLVIAKDNNGNSLYEVQANKKERTIPTQSDMGEYSSLTNSIVNILKNVKAQIRPKNSVSIEEILKQLGYKTPVILEQQESK